MRVYELNVLTVLIRMLSYDLAPRTRRRFHQDKRLSSDFRGPGNLSPAHRSNRSADRIRCQLSAHQTAPLFEESRLMNSIHSLRRLLFAVLCIAFAATTASAQLS